MFINFTCVITFTITCVALYNSLYSHQHSSLFHFCFELHTLSFNPHLHLHDPWWTNTSSSIWIINSVQTSTMLINTNIKWIVSPDLILTSVGLTWHGWLFIDTHFIGPLKLEANDSRKNPLVQTLDNAIRIF